MRKCSRLLVVLVLLLLLPARAYAQSLPPALRARLERAGDALRRGDLAAAREQYEQLARRRPDVAPVWAGLGVVRDALGDRPGAVQAFQKLVALAPDSAAAHNNLGWELYEENRIDEAEDQFAQAIRLDPTHRRAHLNLGLCFLRQGNTEVALAEFLAIQQKLGDSDDLEVDLGLAYQANRHWDLAEKAYRRAIGLRPGNVEARINLATLLAALGRASEARPLLEQVLDLPAAPISRSMAQNGLASLAWADGDVVHAIDLWHTALKTDPANDIAADNLARAELLVKAGNRREARDIFERLARTHPDDERILTCLGAARWDTGDGPGAIQAYDRALRVNPDSAAAHVGEGIVEEALHQPKAAFEHFFRAVELAPESALAHYWLARAYLDQHQWKSADAELKKACTLDPRFTDLARRLQKNRGQSTK